MCELSFHNMLIKKQAKNEILPLYFIPTQTKFFTKKQVSLQLSTIRFNIVRTMSLDFDYLYGMKTFLYIFLSVAFLCWGVSCKKDEKSNLIHTINGTCKYWGISGHDTKSFTYTFSYDKQDRVNKLVYQGELYVYGEGMIHALYTYAIDYNSGSHPTVTLAIENPVIITDKGPVSYEGLPEKETLSLSFGAEGYITTISGRNLWFFTKTTTLDYQSGNLSTIREDNGDYYEAQVSQQWSAGNIISWTHDSFGYNGNISYSILRQFTHSDTPNNEFIDLNWLTANLGLEFQFGITPLALAGLLRNRTKNLINGSTEYDGSKVEISYEMDENGRVQQITHNTLGTDYTFTLSYY